MITLTHGLLKLWVPTRVEVGGVTPLKILGNYHGTEMSRSQCSLRRNTLYSFTSTDRDKGDPRVRALEARHTP